MATTRKTITVTDTQDAWIKAQVEAGKYTNDSEYLRDLIRQDQDRNGYVQAIRAALIEGEKSGRAEPFDGDRFKDDMAARHAGKRA